MYPCMAEVRQIVTAASIDEELLGANRRWRGNMAAESTPESLLGKILRIFLNV